MKPDIIIICPNKEMFDVIAAELTDWYDDYMVKPRDLQFRMIECTLCGVIGFLNSRRINLELVEFETINKD